MPRFTVAALAVLCATGAAAAASEPREALPLEWFPGRPVAMVGRGDRENAHLLMPTSKAD